MRPWQLAPFRETDSVLHAPQQEYTISGHPIQHLDAPEFSAATQKLTQPYSENSSRSLRRMGSSQSFCHQGFSVGLLGGY